VPFGDPSTWAQGFGALKAAFDSINGAIKIVKDMRSLGGGTEQEKKALDTAAVPITEMLAIRSTNAQSAGTTLREVSGTKQQENPRDSHDTFYPRSSHWRSGSNSYRVMRCQ
jgi:hypothetical protein